MAKVVDVHVKSLRLMGYQNFEDWLSNPNHVYIGRHNHYVKGTFQSKWHNPFTVKSSNLHTVLDQYIDHVEASGLRSQINELKGKTLGCWCVNADLQSGQPIRCHGQILLRYANPEH